jgi:hypothetical protein
MNSIQRNSDQSRFQKCLDYWPKCKQDRNLFLRSIVIIFNVYNSGGGLLEFRVDEEDAHWSVNLI